MSVVGWVGLGKLGAPCAAALASQGGHTVVGYDVRGVDPDDYDWDNQRAVDLVESIDDVVRKSDGVVFVAVQTPHSRYYGGETPLGHTLVDFEYNYLVNAVRDVCVAARTQTRDVTLVVVSTVLPGTFDRRLRPLLNKFVTPVYHPFFIAMGSVVDDFVNPEMTLFGVDRAGDEVPVLDVYASLHDDPPAPTMSIPSAELTKVAYNTFITAKIVFANTLMELAEHTGADVDSVTDALALANDRVVSPRYLRAGMGDGGACHPRDNIALAALADQHGVYGNYFLELIRLRERQSDYLASVVQHWTNLSGLPVVVLGQAYKANVAMDAGSPALLLSHGLSGLGVEHVVVDPLLYPSHTHLLAKLLKTPHVYFIATLHTEFTRLTYPSGSVVVDPHGVTYPQAGVTFVTPGRRRSS